MNYWLYKINYITHKQVCNPLFKNSVYILLSSVLNAAFGFIFWMIAAKLYNTADVGIATAIISSIGLLVLFSRLGMDFSLIRHIQTYDINNIFNTSAIVTNVSVVVFGIIYIIGIETFSPELILLKSYSIAALFMLCLIGTSMTTLTNTSFIAIRKARFQFVQSLLMGSRILLLFAFIDFNIYGIFSAVGISYVLVAFIAIVILKKESIYLNFKIDSKFLAEAFHFSVGNYVASIFITAPNLILPIIVLNTLGAESAAYYYIAYAIVAPIFMIPYAISMSLFVEGSHGESLKKNILYSIIITSAILIPTVLLFYSLSNVILGLLGPEYVSNSNDLFRLMLIGSFFVGFNYICQSIQRIKKDIQNIVLITGIVFALLIGLGYLFMNMYGIDGMGYAWLISSFIGCLINGFIIWKNKND